MKKLLIKLLIIVFALTFSFGAFTACGGDENPTHTHDYKTLKFNTENHWHECECGETTALETHTGGTSNCKEKATCEVCQGKYGELSECNFVNGTCDVCGKKKASEGFEYEAVTINGVEGFSVSNIGTCEDTDIVIPNEYKSKPVLGISNNAFKGYHPITNVVIGENVVIIGDYAFSQCYLIESVLMGDAVTSIGENAFENCSSLTTIEISDSVTSIAFGAFDGCFALTIYCELESEPSTWDSEWNYSVCPVVWDSTNSDIADDGNVYTVSGGIRYLVKDNVATIVRQSMGIEIVNIPSVIEYKGDNYNVNSISNDAFKNCNFITNIEIPNSITSIPKGAFEGCYAFTIYCEAESRPSGWEDFWNEDCPIVWDSKNNDVAHDGFIYVIIDGVRYSLKKHSETDYHAIIAKQPLGIKIAQIAENVTYKGATYKAMSIEDRAFYNCDLLTAASTGDYGLTTIGVEAFAQCDLLKVLIIGQDVTHVHRHAFYGCNSLHIYARRSLKPGTWYTDWNASKCDVTWGSSKVSLS